MYLVINKCVTAVIISNFSGHYLRNRSNSDIGVLVKSLYFNLRNILPKSGTFPPGHPVYIYNKTYNYLFDIYNPKERNICYTPIYICIQK